MVTDVIVLNFSEVVWEPGEVKVSVSDGAPPAVVPKIVTVGGAENVTLPPLTLTDNVLPSAGLEG